MKLSILSFLGISLIITIILTPVVCEILIYGFGYLPFPFSRVFDRVILFVALALIAMNAPALRKGALSEKLRLAVGKFSESATGFLISAISGILLIAVYIFLGQLSLKSVDSAYLTRKLLEVVPVAFLIAGIEEFFFRGFIFKKLSSTLPIFAAMVLTSALYAVVHFLAPVKTFTYKSGDLFSGFQYVTVLLSTFANTEYLPAFIGLFLAGMVLADLVRRRKNSLAYAIGTHAGWIVAIKVATFVSVAPDGHANNSEILRRYYLVSQFSGWAEILVIWYLGSFYIHSKSKI
jgi:membrane protease YdiL (CAAX protease family)